MTINGINGVNTQMGQMGMNQTTDSYSRSIQNQIANAQKQLQELSSNEDMTLEAKMKKRQEIQQQISDMNMQLRQHQIEQRKEKQQAKGSSMDHMLGGTGSAKAGNKSIGLSQTGMAAMISADNSIKQAKIQGSVATSLEGRAGVLKAEIKNSHGGNVEKKKEELADIEQKAQAATSSQLSALTEANKATEEAAKADSKAEKIGNKDAKTADTKEKGSDENVTIADTQAELASSTESVTTQADVSVSKDATDKNTAPQPITSYTSVDIRL